MTPIHGSAIVEIFLGSVPGIAAVLGYLWRMDRNLSRFLVEHEILVLDYCRREKITPDMLPTRTKLMAK
jgi:hypothetical protein